MNFYRKDIWDFRTSVVINRKHSLCNQYFTNCHISVATQTLTNSTGAMLNLLG